MNRDEAIRAIDQRHETWDVLVIGGGASGLGSAVDAASRGHRTLLLEQHDFAKGTSSRSTKLVHGGVRYLRQGNISLVRESLRERALLLRNAPHLARVQPFIVPAYSRMDAAFYGVGLKLYDALAGRFSLGPSRLLSLDRTLAEVPTVQAHGLRGGIQYFDGQFDDARLAVALSQTVFDLGGVAANYVRVARFIKEQEKLRGVVAVDAETGREFEIRARAIINATGVFSDSVRHLDDETCAPLVTMSQGAHIVVDRRFLPGPSALMIPKTSDGRVLFAIPWHERVLIGTTDTPVNEAGLEPRPLAEEIEFLLEHAARHLTRIPTVSDILSAFAGLRPLVKAPGARRTANLSRDHVIVVSPSGLVTITGGKWTTYRQMGEDAVNRAAEIAALPAHPTRTRELRLHQAPPTSATSPLLHPRLPYRENDVAQAARFEMARSVEDVLARRTRALILNARAAIEAAPSVAHLMASELGHDAGWEDSQIEAFNAVAKSYLPA